MSFSEWRESTIANLDLVAHQERELPSQFACVTGGKAAAELELQSRFFTIGESAELRTVTIRSPKIDIAVQFLFPEPGWELPVFAMEAVVLGPKPIVAVFDAVTMLPDMQCEDSVKRALRQARNDWADLEQADDAPDWYLDCRSGDDFFIRPKDRDEVERVGLAHQQVWRAIVELLKRPRRLTEAAVSNHRKALRHYKDHHRVNSPGLTLMNRTFGEQWTEDFMVNVLFR